MTKSILKFSVSAIVAASALVGSFASARSVDRTPVVASVEGRLGGVVAAYLLADGRLQIKLESGTVDTVFLSKPAMSYLTVMALEVSGAKLTETTSMATCRMIAPDSLGQLSVSGFNDDDRVFDSARVLVLTNSDCTVAHKVKPSNTVIAQKAVEFRAALTALALGSLTAEALPVETK